MPGTALAKIKGHLDASLRWLGSAIREPTFDPFGAMVVMLVALAWQLVKTAIARPDLLIVIPLIAAFLAAIAAIFLCLGAAGWLVVLLIQALVRWRLREEIRPGMARAEIALVIFGAIFLGIPGIYDSVVWWQEHVLRFLPYETAALDAVQAFYRTHADTIFGLLIMAATGCIAFWPVYRNFPAKFRAGRVFLGQLVADRKWRVPVILGVAIILTVTLMVHDYSDLLAAILSLEIALLALWFFLPAIVYYLVFILAGAAWLGPAAVVNERVSEDSHLWYFVIAVTWGVWLCTPFMIRASFWRIPFWAGVLGFVAYIVR